MLSSCKLCGSSSPLRRSHVLPEFLYRPTYDTTNTAVYLNLKYGKRSKRQQGIHERLLCEHCEQRFGKWESYFAKLWFHPTLSIRPAELNSNTVTISGIEYDQFKLFHISLIWRSGVSTLGEFADVTLGKHEPKIRNLLLTSDPGEPSDYPFFGIALKDVTTGGFQDELVKLPNVLRIRGHRVYSFVFGGVSWYYFVSSHAGKSSVPYLFDRSGMLTLAVQLCTDDPWVRAMAYHSRSLFRP